MTTLFFTLHLSRHVAGMVKGPVKATEASIVGHYVDGKPYAPDIDSVRNCLPARYRKAFDRSGGRFWFDKHDDSKPANLSLSDTWGRYLNTIYAQLYLFNSEV